MGKEAVAKNFDIILQWLLFGQEETMLVQGRLFRNILVTNMDRQLEEISTMRFQKAVCELKAEEAYIVVICLVKRLVDSFEEAKGEKKLYYISPYFEKRMFLRNNLQNLGIFEVLERILREKGQNIKQMEEVEKEYLGTQNLYGEGAEKFLEAMDETGLPGEAIGIRSIRSYEQRGQKIQGWESEKSWLEKEDTIFHHTLGNVKAQSVLYNIEAAGENKEIYKYRLFDLEIENWGKLDEKEIYSEYFLISSAVRLILKRMRENQYDLRKLHQYAEMKMEGKYRGMVIPEMLRILVMEKAIPLKESVEIVKKVCGYSDDEEMLDNLKQCPDMYVELLLPGLIEKIESLWKTESEK